MLGLIYLASALLLGTAITRRLGLRLVGFEAPAMSTALGLVLWTWLSFLGAVALPYAFSLPLTVGLAAAASIWLWRASPAWKWTPLPGGGQSWIAWGVFTAATTLLLGWLMWTHNLITSQGSLYSANSTWADFGLHASLISHFAVADRLPLDFPVAAGTHLTYPFMVDLLSAWLLRGGWSLHLAILIPSLLLIMAFLQLILSFGVRLLGGIGGAIAGLTLALLGGSAVGVFTAATDFHNSGLSLPVFLAHLPQDYTALTSPNAQVTNLIADIILPQRAFVMGLAAFATVLVLLAHLRHHPSLKLELFAGALVGLLPLIHAHTFLILVALVSSLWVERWLKTKHLTGPWFTVGAVSLLVATPQIAWQSLANGTGTGGHLALGWTILPGEPLLSFWIHNYGLTGLLILGLTVALVAQRSLRQYLVWYAPLVVVFIAANIYSLQPFAYDNLKLILYVYLFSYILAAYGAIWLIRRYRLAALPLAAAAILLTASGSLAVAREFQHQDVFASSDDIALAEWVRDATPASAVFITTDRPNQPVATLGGRSIVAGYRGWLYNYHLNYEPRLAAIQDALRGQLTAQNPYQAHYLAVASSEPAEWAIDRPALDASYQRAYCNASWTVYRLPAP